MENKEEIKEFQNYLIQEAQAQNKDPEKYVKELGEDGLKEAYQRFQKSKKRKAQKAAHGAKLQYFKSLKHQCAEDEELVYYKKGGSLGCGCVKKKMEEGGQTPKKSPVDKFRNAWTKKDEQKLDSLSSRKKLTPQGQKEKERLQNKFKKSPNRKDYEIDEGKKGMKVGKDCGGSTLKLKKKGGEVCPKCGKVHIAGMGCAVAKFKAARCGTKMKKQ